MVLHSVPNTLEFLRCKTHFYDALGAFHTKTAVVHRRWGCTFVVGVVVPRRELYVS
jgi:hypothetical protein